MSVPGMDSNTVTLPEAKLEMPAMPTAEAPAVAAPSVEMSAPAMVDQVSAFFEDTLPNGFALKGAKDGVESKLVAFIKDAGLAVDKETWFTMEGITFDTGKATLKPESNIQLNNINEILKAFPALKLKVGGYTDNTGDAKAIYSCLLIGRMRLKML